MFLPVIFRTFTKMTAFFADIAWTISKAYAVISLAKYCRGICRFISDKKQYKLASMKTGKTKLEKALSDLFLSYNPTRCLKARIRCVQTKIFKVLEYKLL